MNEPNDAACDDCRIEISTDGIEVDSSTGNLYLEAGILMTVIAVLYIGKKLVDKYIK
jgi:hypothetical protein|tara:strand:- start:289 stop:459 length:171 start_codon:yes stop_codon:yes gene_type:complete